MNDPIYTWDDGANGRALACAQQKKSSNVRQHKEKKIPATKQVRVINMYARNVTNHLGP